MPGGIVCPGAGRAGGAHRGAAGPARAPHLPVLPTDQSFQVWRISRPVGAKTFSVR